MKKKKTSEPEKQVPADERNIVAVDEAYKEASLEDRVYLIWHKYSSWIVAVVIAVFAGLILYFALIFLAERRETAIREAYAAATTPEARETFVRENAGHPLAGAASLELADQRFEGEDYEGAAEFYAFAAESLTGHPLKGRARLGEAVAYVMLDRPEDAERVLAGLAGDEDILQSVRMEAKYSLASLAFEQGDYDRVRDLARELEEEDMMGFWSNRTRMLVDDIP